MNKQRSTNCKKKSKIAYRVDGYKSEESQIISKVSEKIQCKGEPYWFSGQRDPSVHTDILLLSRSYNRVIQNFVSTLLYELSNLYLYQVLTLYKCQCSFVLLSGFRASLFRCCHLVICRVTYCEGELARSFVHTNRHTHIHIDILLLLQIMVVEIIFLISMVNFNMSNQTCIITSKLAQYLYYICSFKNKLAAMPRHLKKNPKTHFF